LAGELACKTYDFTVFKKYLLGTIFKLPHTLYYRKIYGRTLPAVYGQIAAMIKEIKTAEDIINTVLTDAKLTLNQLRDFSLS